MARGAERLKVEVDVRTAAREREPMVNFGRGHVDTALQALLAQRMLGNVSVTDALPRAAVPFLFYRIAVILFILFVDQLLMLLAVAAGRQQRAARVGTRSLGVDRH